MQQLCPLTDTFFAYNTQLFLDGQNKSFASILHFALPTQNFYLMHHDLSGAVIKAALPKTAFLMITKVFLSAKKMLTYLPDRLRLVFHDETDWAS